jgi:pyrimidine-nucleoside phosphorylase
MTPAQIIAKKRDGLPLSREEIEAFVSGFSRGDIADYQMTALAMAIYLRGMSPEETAALTDAMLASGKRLPSRIRVDKHSTGGVGDKTSLILAPLLACCGLVVPMISGRGLGPTGGTLDKLQSIPGFRTDLNLAEIEAITQRVGCVITGASDEIAPADKRLYELRDVTATINSIPLITASVMSKKLAESLNALVLDVKFGSGAFMKSLDDARTLARSLVDTGRRMGVRTTALLTDMNQPLGRMAGNLVEVHEAIWTLEGRGPADVWDCTRELAAELLMLTFQAQDRDAARHMLDMHIASGRAIAQFREMVAAQGGRLEELPAIGERHEITLDRTGHVLSINTEQLGLAIIELGGGRKLKTDSIDYAVGLETLVRVGDYVEAGRPVVHVFATREKCERIRNQIASAFSLSDQPVPPLALIVERVE